MADNSSLYLPQTLRGKLLLPDLLPELFHLLSHTPTFTHWTNILDIPTQWQMASSVLTYLDLFQFIVPATTSLAAEQRLYLTADRSELTFLEAALREASTRWQLYDCEERRAQCRQARRAYDAKEADVQKGQKKFDALTRVGELLMEMAGLLGRAVVMEAEANEQWAMRMELRHDLGTARDRLAALRVDIVGVAGRVDLICGKLAERSHTGASSSTRAIDETERQRMIDEVLRRCKQGEELGIRPLQRPIEDENEQDEVRPGIELTSQSFRPRSPPRSLPPFPPRLTKARDDEIGVVSTQQESQGEMPTTRVKAEQDLETDDGREPEGVFRMSP